MPAWQHDVLIFSSHSLKPFSSAFHIPFLVHHISAGRCYYLLPQRSWLMFSVLCGQFNSSNTLHSNPQILGPHHSGGHRAARNLWSSCQVMFLTHISRLIFAPGSVVVVCPGVVAEYNYICGLAAKQQSQIKSACTKWTISNDLGQNVHCSHFFRFNNFLFNTWIMEIHGEKYFINAVVLNTLNQVYLYIQPKYHKAITFLFCSTSTLWFFMASQFF